MTKKTLHDAVQINFVFWIMMLLATTIGELTGNYVSRDMGLGYIAAAGLLIGFYFIIATTVILLEKKHFSFFWLLIISGNIGGTPIADFVTDNLGFGNIQGSLLIASILILLLICLKILKSKDSKNLNMMRISDFIYWMAILTSSTFGTTFGDLITSDTPLGALGGSVLLFLFLILLAGLFKMKKISAMLAYWIALVVVHPIGATFANYISKPIGLNFGNVSTGIVLVLTFLIFLLRPFMKRQN